MDKPLQTLHKALREQNYDVPESYDDFEYTLSLPGDAGYQNRHALWQSLKDDNFDVPDNYDDFRDTLFGTQKGKGTGMIASSVGSAQEPTVKAENGYIFTQGGLDSLEQGYKPEYVAAKTKPQHTEPIDLSRPQEYEIPKPFVQYQQEMQEQTANPRLSQQWASQQAAAREQIVNPTKPFEERVDAIQQANMAEAARQQNRQQFDQSNFEPFFEKHVTPVFGEERQAGEQRAQEEIANIQQDKGGGLLSKVIHAVKSDIATERHTDPEKIANATLQRVQDDDAFGDYVLSRMGINGQSGNDDGDSPQLSEREKEFMKQLFAKETGEVTNQIVNRIYDNYKREGAPQSTLDYIAGKAFHENMVASLYDAMVRRVAGSSGMCQQLRAMAYQEYGDNAGWLTQMVGGAAPFAVDMLAGGFALPNAVGQAVVKGGMRLAAKEVAKKMEKRAVARGIEGAALREAVNGASGIAERYIATNAPIVNIALRTAGGAANFATYDVQSELIRQIADGEFKPFDLMKEAAHGALIGSAMGVTGGLIGRATQSGSLAQKVAGDVAAVASETGIFAAANGIQKAIDQGIDITDVDWADTTGEALSMVVGMKATGAVMHPKQLLSRYRNSKDLGLQFNEHDIEELKSHGYDFDGIFKGLGKFGEIAPQEPQTIRRGATEYTANPDGTGRKRNTTVEEVTVDTNAYDSIMNNPELSSSVKRKLAYIVTGKVLSLEPTFGATLDIDDNGKATITTLNAYGNVIDTKEYDNADEARKDYQALQEVARTNTIGGLERIAEKAGFPDVLDEAKGRTREETGVDVDDIDQLSSVSDEKASEVLDAYQKNLQEAYMQRFNGKMKAIEAAGVQQNADGTQQAAERNERRQAAYERGATVAEDESLLPELGYESKLAAARMTQLMPDGEQSGTIRQQIMQAVESGDMEGAEAILQRQSPYLTPQQREAVEGWLDAIETNNGVDDAVSDMVANYEQEKRDSYSAISDPQGNVTPLILKDGTRVYYQSGDINGFHSQVIVTDGPGSQPRQISSSDIVEVGDSYSVDELVSNDVSNYEQSLRNEYAMMTNGSMLLEGQQADIAMGNQIFRVTNLGNDEAGNYVLQMPDGSRMAMTPEQLGEAVGMADNVKIQQQLTQEAQAEALRQQTQRFNAGIVGYKDGTPSMTAKDTKPEVAAEYLLSQTGADGQPVDRKVVLDRIQGEIDRINGVKEKTLQILQQIRNNMAMADEDEPTYHNYETMIKGYENELEYFQYESRKWGEIRQAMMTDEERQAFEKDRIKAVSSAKTQSKKDVASDTEAIPQSATQVPTAKELVAQYPERGDGETFVEEQRKQLSQQYRNDVYPTWDNIQKRLDDYQHGLSDLSPEEIKQLTDEQARLEALMSQMVDQQNAWKKLGSDLGREYGKMERQHMTPHEQAMQRLQNETDKAKKIKLAQEAFKDDPDALSALENLEPQDIYEFVAANLGAGSINWEGIKRGEHHVRGLQEEMGKDKTRGIGPKYDTNPYNYFLAPEGEGKGIEEVAHNMAEGSPYDVQDVKNAIITMLGQATKPTDVSHYIENARIAEAERIYEANRQRERDAELEAEDEAIRQMTGMEPEEYDAFMGDLEQRLAEQEGYRTSEEYFKNILEDERAREERSLGGSQEASAVGMQRQEGDEAGASQEGQGGAGEAVEQLKKVNKDIDALCKKYNSLAPVETFDSQNLTDEQIQDVAGQQLTPEEIEEGRELLRNAKTPSFYSPFSKKIYIFADKYNPEETEEWFFHENVHRGLDQYYGDNPMEVAEAFWNTESPTKPEVTTKHKEAIQRVYADQDEATQHEEYLVHMLGHYMTTGKVDRLLERMSPEHQEIIKNILKNIKYDTTTEAATRNPEEAVQLEGSNQEDALQQKGGDTGRGVSKSSIPNEKSQEVLKDVIQLEGNPNYSEDEQKSLKYVPGESFEEYAKRNNSNVYQEDMARLYLQQKYADRLDEIADIIGNLTEENAGEAGRKIGMMVDDRAEGYGMLYLLNTINPGAILPFNDGVSEAFTSFPLKLQKAKGETNTNPTEEQTKAGNYKMGHIRFGGYRMSIETPKGSTRSGVDRNGQPWSIEMQDTYGYIGQKYGTDGDHLDFFINDDADLDTWNGRVYVVDQKNEDGTFDEHKVMYGYPTFAAAKRAYERNYEPGWWDKHVMQMTGVRKESFDKWLNDSDHKRKPFADYSRTRNSETVNSNADQLLADVEERKNVTPQPKGIAPVFKTEDLKGKTVEELKQLRKKENQDRSMAKLILGTTDAIAGTEKEQTLKHNILRAETNMATIDQLLAEKDAETRKRIEQQEIGGAMVDQLESMGFDVSTDPKENRRIRKIAEKDKSEEGKMRHFETRDGKIYGFVYKGKMYLDPTKIDAELPLHEYAHPWCEAFRRLNPEGWKNIVGLMKADNDTWEFIKALNPDLKSEDDIAEEMITKCSGQRGAEYAKAEYERMNGKDPDYKSKWGNIWKNISKAIQDFWKQVGDFLHIKYESAEQVYDQVIRDFANKVNPRRKVEQYLKERDDAYLGAVLNGDNEKATAIFNDALRENIGNGIVPFVSAGGYRGKLSKLAHGVKSRDPKVIAEVADLMAPLIPKDAVLVPAPSHTGKATDMLDLANAISERTGAPVADVLTSGERGSQYEAKYAGRPLSANELGIVAATESLPAGKIPVVIDNVVDTGNTAEACVQALGKGIVASLADSADRYKHVASLKSAEPIVVDKNGNVVPLSKRFEISGKYLEKAEAQPQRTAKEPETGDMASEAPVTVNDTDTLLQEVERRKTKTEEEQAEDIVKRFLSMQPNGEEEKIRHRATKAVLKTLDKAGVPYKVVSKEEEKQMMMIFSMMNQDAVKAFARRADIRAMSPHGVGKYCVYNMNDPFGVPIYAEKLSIAQFQQKQLRRMAPEGEWAILNIGYPDETVGNNELRNAADMNVDDLQAMIGWHGSGQVFTKFDHSHMGEGAGSQVFGWGTYITSGRGVAEGYAHKDEIIKKYNGVIVNPDPYSDNAADRAMFYVQQEHGVNNAIKFLKDLIREEEDKSVINDYQETIKVLQDKDNWSDADKVLYKVDIPDDTGENYLDWMVTIKKPLRRKIADAVRQLDGEPQQSFIFTNYKNGWQSLADMIEREQFAYKEIHDRLLMAFGGRVKDAEKVSKLMNSLGFVGVKYPAGTIWGGGNGATNYVIFNEDDAKITDTIQFMIGDEADVTRQHTEQPIFISNALQAVEGIKQEKATPEQWLAMIQKNGGLKSGEDKWLGLSDWLNEHKGEKLTKQDVLDFIRQNQVQVEETHYSEFDEEGSRRLADLNKEFDAILDKLEKERNAVNAEIEVFDQEMYEKYGQGWANDRKQLSKEDRQRDRHISNRYSFLNDNDLDQLAFADMVEKYGDDFGDAFEVNYNGDHYELIPSLDIYDEPTDAAKRFLNTENVIHSTRLRYTTDGLENKKEIALTVPTIEPYNESDSVHFGDAGGGRTVAWVRFGDTVVKVGVEPKVVTEFEAPYRNVNGMEVYSPEGEKYGGNDYIVHGKIRTGEDKYVIVMRGKQVAAYDTFDEARDAMNQWYKDNNVGKPITGKVLVLDEIQSKRHQDARELGYQGEFTDSPKKQYEVAYDQLMEYKQELDEKYGEYHVSDQLTPEERAKYDEMYQKVVALSEVKDDKVYTVPDAPFEKNWHELAMKRMLRYAAENGYDKIAWTTGEQQAERYSLSKSFDSIEREDNPSINGRRFVFSGNNVENFVVDDQGKVIDSTISDAKGKDLSDLVGKDMAVKLMGMENGDMLEGENLRIGGEGMKGFYDEMLPRFMNKYGKKWGVKVGEVELPGLEKSAQKMWSIDVTPEMKESVMQGQPMFQKDGKRILGWSDGKQVYLTQAGLNPNTPIHECTHLWDKWCMKEHPDLWKKLVNALKKTSMWEEIAGNPNYRNIWNDEDRMASEVHSRLSGTTGEDEFMKAAFKKDTPQSIINEVKSALRKFWEAVLRLFTKHAKTIADDFESLQSIIRMPIRDLVNQDFEKVMKVAGEDAVSSGDAMLGYHGSSAIFDRFDLSKVGSGEGQAVSGYGTYITTSEGTARYYADVAQSRHRKVVQEMGYTVDGKVVKDPALVRAYDYLQRANSNVDEAIKACEHTIEVLNRHKDKNPFAALRGDGKSIAEEAMDYLRMEQEKPGTLGFQEEVVEQPARQLYEVDIPDDTGKNYFDLDKKLTQKQKDDIKRRFLDTLNSSDDADYWKKNRDIIDYDWKMVDAKDAVGGTAVGVMEQFLPSKDVSEILSDMGYVGSKVKGSDGTTYIVYHEDDIAIKNRVQFMIDFHIEDNDDTVARLEREPKEIGYRNVVLNDDGSLGSPMANRLGKKGVGRKATTPFEYGKWERSDEHPELATEDGKIDLIKPGNKEVGGVDYNPYIHIRPNKVNKQFKQAWERPNLIYVETEYPKSELEGNYQAEKAALPVGKHPWGGGELILSRWDKPVRMVPWEEVADDWEKEFAGRGVEFDIVPPALLPILAERGVEILPPHKGMGKACNEAYEAWKDKADVTRQHTRQELMRRSTPAVEAANERFNKRLMELDKDRKQKDRVLKLGNPGTFLLAGGIQNGEIVMDFDRFVKKSSENYEHDHPFTAEDIKDLPKSINAPIAVFDSTHGNDKVILTELQKNGRNFVVVIRATEQHRKGGVVLEVNEIQTLFPKDAKGIVKWFMDGLFTNVDKEKALSWIKALPTHPGTSIDSKELDSAAKIVNSFENPKLSDEKIREIYPEYTDAGDTTAEQLGGVGVVWEQQTMEPGTKGWYNPNDNTVHIAIDEVEDVDDVKRTVFHEKLGHEGLVALLGSQAAVNKFGSFIFGSAKKGIRQRIMEKADDIDPEWKDGARYSKAAQEVFADIAADGPKTADEFNLWTKVKHYIIRFCNKIGLRIRGLLNDKDLAYYVLKTGEALKRWDKMSAEEKADMMRQSSEQDILRSRGGKPRKRNNESDAQYFQRLREWEKWRIARQTARDNGDQEPTEEQFHEQAEADYREAMREWEREHGIAEGQTFSSSFPKRGENESPQEYAMRVADYEAQHDLWATAPQYMDFMRQASEKYRRAYTEWRERYDLEEQASVDQRLYEGDVPLEPTFNDADEEAHAMAERELADEAGFEIDEQGAKRMAKLAVIERRKNFESANAEDAIWVYDFVKQTEEVAKQIAERTGQRVTGKEIREALPFLIEADRRKENMEAEREDAVMAINMSEAIQQAHSFVDFFNLDEIGEELKALNEAWRHQEAEPDVAAKQAYRDAAARLAEKLNSLNADKAGYNPLFADDIMQIRSLLTSAVIAGRGNDMPESTKRFADMPEIQPLMEHIKEWYDEFFQLLEDAGLRGDAGYIEDGYVNHVWDKEKSDPKAWEKYIENRQRTKSPNMRHREIDTYMDGIEIGLVPKYTDIADMIAHYSRQNNEAVANRRFLDDLKFVYVQEMNDEGEVTAVLPLLMVDKPDGLLRDRYAQYYVPGVGDVYVMKHIQKRFANIFGTMRTPDAAEWLSDMAKGYDLISSTAKKIQLALSGFHALALFEVDVAQNNPAVALKHLLKYIITDSYKSGTLPAYAHPEDFKLAAKHLVQLGATEDYAAADVNAITARIRETFKALDESDEVWKKAVGVAGSPAAIFMDWINKGFDTVLWNYLHDGLKLSAFKELAKQIDERVEKKGLDEKTRDQLLDEAGQYVNDMFGGQYWELINVSPTTLKWMRRAFLSPDWLISTQRHFFANFGFGSVYSDGGFREYIKYNSDNIKRLLGSDVPSDELRRLRSKNAKYCYLVGAMVWWGIFYNAINALCRWMDEDDEKKKAEDMRKTNPSYKSPYELAYPNGMKWYDYTMYGNAIGQQTHLFTGRYSDGTETYVRWGKQFREFPELFMGRYGVEFPAPLIQRMMSKANPNIGTAIDFLGAQNIGGFNGSYENKELREKYGKTIATLASTARHFIPFGMPTQTDKEYKWLDFFMPSSKGFSRWKAKDYFETFILDGDWDGIDATYNACVMNGVDAEKALDAAIASIKATQKKELADGVTDLSTAAQKFDAATTPDERAVLHNKLKKHLKASEYKVMTRQDARDKVQAFIDGDKSEKENTRYIMLATSEDIIAEEKLKDLNRKARGYVKKVNDAPVNEQEALEEKYSVWFDIYDITKDANKDINDAKKLLGGMDDKQLMEDIRKAIRDAQKEIDELNAPK